MDINYQPIFLPAFSFLSQSINGWKYSTMPLALNSSPVFSFMKERQSTVLPFSRILVKYLPVSLLL